MGKGLAAQYAVARSVFEEAGDALGFPLSALCFEGPEDALELTENTQPVLLTVSTAAFRVLAERGFAPDYVAGHSLGEYSALVAAGSLQFADAVRLVRKRGRYMQEAVPPGVGAMAALLRLPEGALDGVLQQAAQGEVVSAANLNAPDQVVIAGHAGAVNRAIELAKAAGTRRAILLQVSAPFHCALMKPAQERLAADLNATDFSDLSCPLVNNWQAARSAHGREGAAGFIRAGTQPGALGGIDPASGCAGSPAFRRSGRGRRAHRPAALHRSEPARFALRRSRGLGQTLRMSCGYDRLRAACNIARA
jgi:[acyl-carrier-protein] S-malonyltransferase